LGWYDLIRINIVSHFNNAASHEHLSFLVSYCSSNVNLSEPTSGPSLRAPTRNPFCPSLRAPTRKPFSIGEVLGIPGQARDDGEPASGSSLRAPTRNPFCPSLRAPTRKPFCPSLRAPTRKPFSIGEVLGIPGQARDDGGLTIFLNLLT